MRTGDGNNLLRLHDNRSLIFVVHICFPLRSLFLDKPYRTHSHIIATFPALCWLIEICLFVGLDGDRWAGVRKKGGGRCTGGGRRWSGKRDSIRWLEAGEIGKKCKEANVNKNEAESGTFKVSVPHLTC